MNDVGFHFIQPNLLATNLLEDVGFCATRTPGERASTQPTNLCLCGSQKKKISHYYITK